MALSRLILLVSLTWAQAGTITPVRKPRPTPIQPDAQSNSVRATTEGVWRPDAYGLWWVVSPEGHYYGDYKKDNVLKFGKPVNR